MILRLCVPEVDEVQQRRSSGSSLRFSTNTRSREYRSSSKSGTSDKLLVALPKTAFTQTSSGGAVSRDHQGMQAGTQSERLRHSVCVYAAMYPLVSRDSRVILIKGPLAIGDALSIFAKATGESEEETARIVQHGGPNWEQRKESPQLITFPIILICSATISSADRCGVTPSSPPHQALSTLFPPVVPGPAGLANPPTPFVPLPECT